MRVDQVIRDPRRTLQEVLRALDSSLTARDNFAPEGVLGQVLMSNGPTAKPTYQDIPSTDNGLSEAEVLALIGSHKHDGSDIVSGQVDPLFLGTGTPDGTKFLRDDGVWSTLSPVAWSALTGVPTDFAGFGLDDDLATALASYYTAAALDAGQLDTRYYTETEVDALFAAVDYPVDSVFGRTGAVIAAAGDYDAFYYTEAEVDALIAAIDFPVDTVFGRTGAVVATAGDYDAFYYTETEIDALLAALTTHDLADWPADAAGVLTNDGAGNYSWVAGGGGGGVTGSGTAGTLPKWNTATDLTDSILVETSSTKVAVDANAMIETSGSDAIFSATDNIKLQAGLGFVILRTSATDRWKVSPAGDFIPEADNAYDIGGAANRPADIYAGGTIILSASIGTVRHNSDANRIVIAGGSAVALGNSGIVQAFGTGFTPGRAGQVLIQGGTGVTTGDDGTIVLETNSTERWKVDRSGNLLAQADGVSQIGLASGSRPSRVCVQLEYYAGGNKVVGTRQATVAAPAATIAGCQTAINAIINRLQLHGLIA